MADRLGPRACAICGPGAIQGCWKCTATIGHCHIEVVDRHGRPMGRVAACRSHAPESGVVVQNPGQRPAQDASAIAKRRRDRERRRAHRIVLDRHADEVDRVLTEIREETT